MPKYEVAVWIEVEADDKTDAYERVQEHVLESGLPMLVGTNSWGIGEVEEISEMP